MQEVCRCQGEQRSGRSPGPSGDTGERPLRAGSRRPRHCVPCVAACPQHPSAVRSSGASLRLPRTPSHFRPLHLSRRHHPNPKRSCALATPRAKVRPVEMLRPHQTPACSALRHSRLLGPLGRHDLAPDPVAGSRETWQTGQSPGPQNLDPAIRAPDAEKAKSRQLSQSPEAERSTTR